MCIRDRPHVVGDARMSTDAVAGCSSSAGGPSSPDMHNSMHESYRKSMRVTRPRPSTASPWGGGGGGGRLRPLSGRRKEVSCGVKLECSQRGGAHASLDAPARSCLRPRALLMHGRRHGHSP
eukprot:2459263-Rhodomonas_salina.2